MDVDNKLAEHLLATAAARRFYLDGVSKSEIAIELGISRFRIARLIEKARRDGIVRIEFPNQPGYIDDALSSALKRTFDLRHAVVVLDHHGDAEAILDSMGQAAARLLEDISTPDEVLGFAWTRVSEAMSRHLAPLTARAVVQLGGAWPGAGIGRTSVDLVRQLATLTRGEAYTFYAPLLASDKLAAEAIRRQPDVESARAMFDRVTFAIVGLGAWKPGMSSLWAALSDQNRKEIAAAGAVGEICGMTIDREGSFLPTRLSDQAIGIDIASLRACPDVLAIAFEVEKAEAIRAAIAGGVVKSLITHAEVAVELLKLRTRFGEGQLPLV